MAKVLAGTAAWTTDGICQRFSRDHFYQAAVRTLGGGEVDDVAVALEHVDLLDGLDGLDVELLERLLKLLVVTGGPRGGALHLSPGSTLATVRRTRLSEYRPTDDESGLGEIMSRHTLPARWVSRPIRKRGSILGEGQRAKRQTYRCGQKRPAS